MNTKLPKLYRTLITVLFLLLLTLPLSAGATEPRLVSTDIGTFHSSAKSIAILDHGERFATVGGDRVIRIYNSDTGTVEKSIAGYADVGDSGMIQSMAASPDSKQLAVGVNFGGMVDVLLDWISREKKNSKGGALFDLKSGKLIRVLGGHALPAQHVFYTNNGKYLISAAQELLAWDADALNGKGKPVEMVAPNSSRLVDATLLWAAPAGNSNQSRILFALADNIRALTLFEVPSRTYIASAKLPDTPVDAVAKGDRIIVSLEQGGIILFDGQLKQVATLAPAIRFGSIDLTADAQALVACAAAPPFGCTIGTRENGFTLAADKPNVRTERPFNALFLNSKRLLLWAGDGELRLVQLPAVKEERRIIPRVPEVRAADLVGNSILMAGDANNKCRSFNLAGGTIAPCAAGEVIAPELPRTWQGYEIKKVKDDNGKAEYHAVKGAFESALLHGGDSDAPAGFLNNGLIALTSAFEGFMEIVTLSGNRMAELIDHEGKITSIRQRGDLIITTATDRTVRLWDITAMRGMPPESLQIEITKVQPGSVADTSGLKEGSSILSVNGKTFRTVADFREMITKAGNFTLTLKNFSRNEKTSTVNLDKPQGILGIGMKAAGEVEFLSHLRPFANVMLTNDGNWALWSEHKPPEKSISDEPARTVRYAASAQGHDLLRWRINQGKEQEAKLQSFDRTIEYDPKLPAVVAAYAAELAARNPGPLSKRFEVTEKEIRDRTTGLIWLRNVSNAFAASGHNPSYLLISINGEKKPLGRNDWRFPTENVTKQLFALLTEQRRRSGSFLEETLPQLMRRNGFQCVSDNFEAIALDGTKPRAWSLADAKGYTPKENDFLRVLLVRE
jgi:WD40 repeat protein